MEFKKAKKYLAGVLGTAVTFATLLAGCGNNSSDAKYAPYKKEIEKLMASDGVNGAVVANIIGDVDGLQITIKRNGPSIVQYESDNGPWVYQTALTKLALNSPTFEEKMNADGFTRRVKHTPYGVSCGIIAP